MRRETKDKANFIKGIRDNKGYAIVMVIVALALGMILVGVLLSISLLNYKMKVTEYNSKDNFYSAEVVLDQIYAGLQNEVSEAAGTAYMEAMQKYKTSDAADAEAARTYQFNQDYIIALREALVDPATGDDTKYYVGGNAAEYNATTQMYNLGLCAFLDQTLASKIKNGSLTVTADGSTTGNMVATASGITLEKLKICYTDDKGFYSEIQTDILIGFPQFSLKETSIIPNVFEYALIAKDSVEFSNVNSAVVKDDMFAGNDGISLSGSGVLFHDDVDYLVTGGEITVDTNSSLQLNSNYTWVRGVTVDGGELVTDTDLYVVDDLTLSGLSPYVSLDGNYYGYSGSKVTDIDLAEGTSAGSQSAMIVNCRKGVLELDNLQELLLGGNAFVGAGAVDTSDVGIAGAVNKDVLLGTSLSNKADQIAFLVPEECIGTSNGVTLVGKNPMTEEEYEKWIDLQADYYNYQFVDETKTVELLGKPLSDYFSGQGGVHYQTVFQNIHGETICYVYLKMNAEQAAVYYRDYVDAASDAMIEYIDRFGNNITLDTDYTDIQAKGNLVTYMTSSDTLTIVHDNLSSDAALLADAQVTQGEYEQRYVALCSKLTTNFNGLTESEKNNNNVYLNLISTSAVSALTEPKIYVYGSNTGIVANSDITVQNQKVTIGGNDYSRVKLIVTSGDVSVQGDFDGLIISGGEVTIHSSTGSVYAQNKEDVTKLLQCKPVGGGTNLSLIETYFINGDRYAFDGSDSNTSTYVDLDGVIAYRNWIKK